MNTEPQLAASQNESTRTLAYEQSIEIARLKVALELAEVRFNNKTITLAAADSTIAKLTETGEHLYEQLSALEDMACVSISRAVELLCQIKRQKTTSSYQHGALTLVEGYLRYDLELIQDFLNPDGTDIPF